MYTELEEAPRASRVRILLFVPDALTGRLLARVLSAAGLELVGLHLRLDDFQHALEEAGADVALIAVRGDGGLHVVEEVRAHGVTLPLLILHDEEAVREDIATLAAHRVTLVRRDHVDVDQLATAAMVLARGLQSSSLAAALNDAASDQTITVKLSPRERDVLSLVARGMDNLKAAACLGVSERAVKGHITALYRKLGCETRVQLALLGIQFGLGATAD